MELMSGKEYIEISKVLLMYVISEDSAYIHINDITKIIDDYKKTNESNTTALR